MCAPRSWPVMPARRSLVYPRERPEKGPDICGQRFRLLQCSKVAPTVHGRPALEVEHPLRRHRARWTEILAGKVAVGSWYLDARAAGGGPVPMAAGIVRPEGGMNGAGHPVQHDIGQDLILGETAFDVSPTVTPAPELSTLHAAKPTGESVRP